MGCSTIKELKYEKENLEKSKERMKNYYINQINDVNFALQSKGIQLNNVENQLKKEKEKNNIIYSKLNNFRQNENILQKKINDYRIN